MERVRRSVKYDGLINLQCADGYLCGAGIEGTRLFLRSPAVSETGDVVFPFFHFSPNVFRVVPPRRSLINFASALQQRGDGKSVGGGGATTTAPTGPSSLSSARRRGGTRGAEGKSKKSKSLSRLGGGRAGGGGSGGPFFGYGSNAAGSLENATQGVEKGQEADGGVVSWLALEDAKATLAQQEVTYGMTFSLVHTASDLYVSVAYLQRSVNDPDCVSIVLVSPSAADSPSCEFIFVPRYKNHSEGDKVERDDELLIRLAGKPLFFHSSSPQELENVVLSQADLEVLDRAFRLGSRLRYFKIPPSEAAAAAAGGLGGGRRRTIRGVGGGADGTRFPGLRFRRGQAGGAGMTLQNSIFSMPRDSTSGLRGGMRAEGMGDRLGNEKKRLGRLLGGGGKKNHKKNARTSKSGGVKYGKDDFFYHSLFVEDGDGPLPSASFSLPGEKEDEEKKNHSTRASRASSVSVSFSSSPALFGSGGESRPVEDRPISESGCGRTPAALSSAWSLASSVTQSPPTSGIVLQTLTREHFDEVNGCEDGGITFTLHRYDEGIDKAIQQQQARNPQKNDGRVGEGSGGGGGGGGAFLSPSAWTSGGGGGGGGKKGRRRHRMELGGPLVPTSGTTTTTSSTTNRIIHCGVPIALFHRERESYCTTSVTVPRRYRSHAEAMIDSLDEPPRLRQRRPRVGLFPARFYGGEGGGEGRMAAPSSPSSLSASATIGGLRRGGAGVSRASFSSLRGSSPLVTMSSPHAILPTTDSNASREVSPAAGGEEVEEAKRGRMPLRSSPSLEETSEKPAENEENTADPTHGAPPRSAVPLSSLRGVMEGGTPPPMEEEEEAVERAETGTSVSARRDRLYHAHLQQQRCITGTMYTGDGNYMPFPVFASFSHTTTTKKKTKNVKTKKKKTSAGCRSRAAPPRSTSPGMGNEGTTLPTSTPPPPIGSGDGVAGEKETNPPKREEAEGKEAEKPLLPRVSGRERPTPIPTGAAASSASSSGEDEVEVEEEEVVEEDEGPDNDSEPTIGERCGVNGLWMIESEDPSRGGPIKMSSGGVGGGGGAKYRLKHVHTGLYLAVCGSVIDDWYRGEDDRLSDVSGGDWGEENGGGGGGGYPPPRRRGGTPQGEEEWEPRGWGRPHPHGHSKEEKTKQKKRKMTPEKPLEEERRSDTKTWENRTQAAALSASSSSSSSSTHSSSSSRSRHGRRHGNESRKGDTETLRPSDGLARPYLVPPPPDTILHPQDTWGAGEEEATPAAIGPSSSTAVSLRPSLLHSWTESRSPPPPSAAPPPPPFVPRYRTSCPPLPHHTRSSTTHTTTTNSSSSTPWASAHWAASSLSPPPPPAVAAEGGGEERRRAPSLPQPCLRSPTATRRVRGEEDERNGRKPGYARPKEEEEEDLQEARGGRAPPATAPKQNGNPKKRTTSTSDDREGDGGGGGGGGFGADGVGGGGPYGGRSTTSRPFSRREPFREAALCLVMEPRSKKDLARTRFVLERASNRDGGMPVFLTEHESFAVKNVLLNMYIATDYSIGGPNVRLQLQWRPRPSDTIVATTVPREKQKSALFIRQQCIWLSRYREQMQAAALDHHRDRLTLQRAVRNEGDRRAEAFMRAEMRYDQRIQREVEAQYVESRTHFSHSARNDMDVLLWESLQRNEVGMMLSSSSPLYGFRPQDKKKKKKKAKKMNPTQKEEKKQGNNAVGKPEGDGANRVEEDEEEEEEEDEDRAHLHPRYRALKHTIRLCQRALTALIFFCMDDAYPSSSNATATTSPFPGSPTMHGGASSSSSSFFSPDKHPLTSEALPNPDHQRMLFDVSLFRLVFEVLFAPFALLHPTYAQLLFLRNPREMEELRRYEGSALFQAIFHRQSTDKVWWEGGELDEEEGVGRGGVGLGGPLWSSETPEVDSEAVKKRKQAGGLYNGARWATSPRTSQDEKSVPQSRGGGGGGEASLLSALPFLPVTAATAFAPSQPASAHAWRLPPFPLSGGLLPVDHIVHPLHAELHLCCRLAVRLLRQMTWKDSALANGWEVYLPYCLQLDGRRLHVVEMLEGMCSDNPYLTLPSIRMVVDHFVGATQHVPRASYLRFLGMACTIGERGLRERQALVFQKLWVEKKGLLCQFVPPEKETTHGGEVGERSRRTNLLPAPCPSTPMGVVDIPRPQRPPLFPLVRPLSTSSSSSSSPLLRSLIGASVLRPMSSFLAFFTSLKDPKMVDFVAGQLRLMTRLCFPGCPPQCLDGVKALLPAEELRKMLESQWFVPPPHTIPTPPSSSSSSSSSSSFSSPSVRGSSSLPTLRPPVPPSRGRLAVSSSFSPSTAATHHGLQTMSWRMSGKRWDLLRAQVLRLAFLTHCWPYYADPAIQLRVHTVLFAGSHRRPTTPSSSFSAFFTSSKEKKKEEEVDPYDEAFPSAAQFLSGVADNAITILLKRRTLDVLTENTCLTHAHSKARGELLHTCVWIWLRLVECKQYTREELRQLIPLLLRWLDGTNDIPREACAGPVSNGMRWGWTGGVTPSSSPTTTFMTSPTTSTTRLRSFPHAPVVANPPSTTNGGSRTLESSLRSFPSPTSTGVAKTFHPTFASASTEEGSIRRRRTQSMADPPPTASPLRRLSPSFSSLHDRCGGGHEEEEEMVGNHKRKKRSDATPPPQDHSPVHPRYDLPEEEGEGENDNDEEEEEEDEREADRKFKLSEVTLPLMVIRETVCRCLLGALNNEIDSGADEIILFLYHKVYQGGGGEAEANPPPLTTTTKKKVVEEVRRGGQAVSLPHSHTAGKDRRWHSSPAPLASEKRDEKGEEEAARRPRRWGWPWWGKARHAAPHPPHGADGAKGSSYHFPLWDHREDETALLLPPKEGKTEEQLEERHHPHPHPLSHTLSSSSSSTTEALMEVVIVHNDEDAQPSPLQRRKTAIRHEPTAAKLLSPSTTTPTTTPSSSPFAHGSVAAEVAFLHLAPEVQLDLYLTAIEDRIHQLFHPHRLVRLLLLVTRYERSALTVQAMRLLVQLSVLRQMITQKVLMVNSQPCESVMQGFDAAHDLAVKLKQAYQAYPTYDAAVWEPVLEASTKALVELFPDAATSSTTLRIPTSSSSSPSSDTIPHPHAGGSAKAEAASASSSSSASSHHHAHHPPSSSSSAPLLQDGVGSESSFFSPSPVSHPSPSAPLVLSTTTTTHTPHGPPPSEAERTLFSFYSSLSHHSSSAGGSSLGWSKKSTRTHVGVGGGGGARHGESTTSSPRVKKGLPPTTMMGHRRSPSPPLSPAPKKRITLSIPPTDNTPEGQKGVMVSKEAGAGERKEEEEMEMEENASSSSSSSFSSSSSSSSSFSSSSTSSSSSSSLAERPVWRASKRGATMTSIRQRAIGLWTKLAAATHMLVVRNTIARRRRALGIFDNVDRSLDLTIRADFMAHFKLHETLIRMLPSIPRSSNTFFLAIRFFYLFSISESTAKRLCPFIHTFLSLLHASPRTHSMCLHIIVHLLYWMGDTNDFLSPPLLLDFVQEINRQLFTKLPDPKFVELLSRRIFLKPSVSVLNRRLFMILLREHHTLHQLANPPSRPSPAEVSFIAALVHLLCNVCGGQISVFILARSVLPAMHVGHIILRRLRFHHRLCKKDEAQQKGLLFPLLPSATASSASFHLHGLEGDTVSFKLVNPYMRALIALYFTCSEDSDEDRRRRQLEWMRAEVMWKILDQLASTLEDMTARLQEDYQRLREMTHSTDRRPRRQTARRRRKTRLHEEEEEEEEEEDEEEDDDEEEEEEEKPFIGISRFLLYRIFFSQTVPLVIAAFFLNCFNSHLYMDMIRHSASRPPPTMNRRNGGSPWESPLRYAHEEEDDEEENDVGEEDLDLDLEEEGGGTTSPTAGRSPSLSLPSSTPLVPATTPPHEKKKRGIHFSEADISPHHRTPSLEDDEEVARKQKKVPTKRPKTQKEEAEAEKRHKRAMHEEEKKKKTKKKRSGGGALMYRTVTSLIRTMRRYGEMLLLLYEVLHIGVRDMVHLRAAVGVLHQVVLEIRESDEVRESYEGLMEDLCGWLAHHQWEVDRRATTTTTSSGSSSKARRRKRALRDDDEYDAATRGKYEKESEAEEEEDEEDEDGTIRKKKTKKARWGMGGLRRLLGAFSASSSVLSQKDAHLRAIDPDGPEDDDDEEEENEEDEDEEEMEDEETATDVNADGGLFEVLVKEEFVSYTLQRKAATRHWRQLPPSASRHPTLAETLSFSSSASFLRFPSLEGGGGRGPSSHRPAASPRVLLRRLLPFPTPPPSVGPPVLALQPVCSPRQALWRVQHHLQQRLHGDALIPPVEDTREACRHPSGESSWSPRHEKVAWAQQQQQNNTMGGLAPPEEVTTKDRKGGGSGGDSLVAWIVNHYLLQCVENPVLRHCMQRILLSMKLRLFTARTFVGLLNVFYNALHSALRHPHLVDAAIASNSFRRKVLPYTTFPASLRQRFALQWMVRGGNGNGGGGGGPDRHGGPSVATFLMSSLERMVQHQRALLASDGPAAFGQRMKGTVQDGLGTLGTVTGGEAWWKRMRDEDRNADLDPGVLDERRKINHSTNPTMPRESTTLPHGPSPAGRKVEYGTALQCIFSALGVMEVVITLCGVEDDVVALNALRVGNAVLENGNVFVQRKLFSYFGSREEGFFQNLRHIFRKHKDFVQSMNAEHQYYLLKRGLRGEAAGIDGSGSHLLSMNMQLIQALQPRQYGMESISLDALLHGVRANPVGGGGGAPPAHSPLPHHHRGRSGSPPRRSASLSSHHHHHRSVHPPPPPSSSPPFTHTEAQDQTRCADRGGGGGGETPTTAATGGRQRSDSARGRSRADRKEPPPPPKRQKRRSRKKNTKRKRQDARMALITARGKESADGEAEENKRRGWYRGRSTARRLALIWEVFRLLQLFCEGHNSELQNYIRSQYDNLHNANMIHESILMLQELSNFLTPSTLPVITQGFELLAECCQGPCHANQEAMVDFSVGTIMFRVLQGAREMQRLEMQKAEDEAAERKAEAKEKEEARLRQKQKAIRREARRRRRERVLPFRTAYAEPLSLLPHPSHRKETAAQRDTPIPTRHRRRKAHRIRSHPRRPSSSSSLSSSSSWSISASPTDNGVVRFPPTASGVGARPPSRPGPSRSGTHYPAVHSTPPHPSSPPPPPPRGGRGEDTVWSDIDEDPPLHPHEREQPVEVQGGGSTYHALQPPLMSAACPSRRVSHTSGGAVGLGGEEEAAYEVRRRRRTPRRRRGSRSRQSGVVRMAAKGEEVWRRRGGSTARRGAYSTIPISSSSTTASLLFDGQVREDQLAELRTSISTFALSLMEGRRDVDFLSKILLQFPLQVIQEEVYFASLLQSYAEKKGAAAAGGGGEGVGVFVSPLLESRPDEAGERDPRRRLSQATEDALEDGEARRARHETTSGWSMASATSFSTMTPSSSWYSLAEDEAVFQWLIFLKTVQPYVVGDVDADCIQETIDFCGNLMRYMGSVEISRESGIECVYFRIPVLCSSLTQDRKDLLLWQVDRTSRTTKLLDFLQKSDELIFSMERLFAVRQQLKYWTRFPMSSSSASPFSSSSSTTVRRSLLPDPPSLTEHEEAEGGGGASPLLPEWEEAKRPKTRGVRGGAVLRRVHCDPQRSTQWAKAFYNTVIAHWLFSHRTSYYERISMLLAVVVCTMLTLGQTSFSSASPTDIGDRSTRRVTDDLMRSISGGGEGGGGGGEKIIRMYQNASVIPGAPSYASFSSSPSSPSHYLSFLSPLLLFLTFLYHSVLHHLHYFFFQTDWWITMLCFFQSLACLGMLLLELWVGYPIQLYCQYKAKQQFLRGESKLNITMHEVYAGLSKRERWTTFLRSGMIQLRFFLLAVALLSTLKSPYFAAFNLLLFVYKINTLRTFISAITMNGKQLLWISFLGIIILYLFSVTGYVSFPKDFNPDDSDDSSADAATSGGGGGGVVVGGGDAVTSDNEDNCATLLRCFVYIFSEGLRAGGGVGDVMRPWAWGSPDMMPRAYFNVFFYVLVNVVYLNILFGIIIDTFGQMRDEKREKETDMHGKCFICGLDSDTLEKISPNGFYTHVKQDHNMWMYLYFMHHLRQKDPSTYTGQESYVQGKIQANRLSFFPNQSCIALLELTPEERMEDGGSSNDNDDDDDEDDNGDDDGGM